MDRAQVRWRKDDFAHAWENTISGPSPNKNPLSDRPEILHIQLRR